MNYVSLINWIIGAFMKNDNAKINSLERIFRRMHNCSHGLPSIPCVVTLVRNFYRNTRAICASARSMQCALLELLPHYCQAWEECTYVYSLLRLYRHPWDQAKVSIYSKRSDVVSAVVYSIHSAIGAC